MFGAMGIGSWLLVGLLAGALAKFFMPGKDPGGCLMTIVIGVVGALIGGYVGSLVGLGSISGFNLPTLLTATAGAFLLLLVLRIVKGRG